MTGQNQPLFMQCGRDVHKTGIPSYIGASTSQDFRRLTQRTFS